MHGTGNQWTRSIFHLIFYTYLPLFLCYQPYQCDNLSEFADKTIWCFSASDNIMCRVKHRLKTCSCPWDGVVGKKVRRRSCFRCLLYKHDSCCAHGALLLYNDFSSLDSNDLKEQQKCLCQFNPLLISRFGNLIGDVCLAWVVHTVTRTHVIYFRFPLLYSSCYDV